MPLRMCRVVLWIIPFMLQVMSFVDGSIPMLLGGSFMEQDLIISCRCPKNTFIIGDTKVCVCMAVLIHIVVYSSVDTPSDWVL